MKDKDLKIYLERLYEQYKHKHSSKDPVWNLHKFSDPRDVEIIGFITSCYAYGQVDVINAFISRFLNAVGNKPYEFTRNFSKLKDKKFLKGLNYRFNTDNDLAYLLQNTSDALKKHSSLQDLFLTYYDKEHINILPALTGFSRSLNAKPSVDLYYRYLVPDLSLGSTCKRLNLFLRWMVRKDDIDLGIWNKIDRSKLIMPVDTHIYRVAKKLKLIKRKTYDIKLAIELTEKLKQFDPVDPVRYDFALCHVSLEKKI